MKILHTQNIKEILGVYGFLPNEAQCEAIRAYISLLLRWNKRVSLTRVTEPEEILRFHFGESLFAISQVPIREGRLADVGSGAGFPGLPLRIALPRLELHLIESNVKKAAFLAEACRELGLDSVNVVRGRMESIPEQVNPFDYVAARALGNYPELLNWASRQIAATGMIVLWLGEDEAQKLATAGWWTWRRPVRIPGSDRRYLLIGEPSMKFGD